MWIPSSVYALITLSAEQRAELASLKIERDHLVRELAESKANFKWMTTQVNQLQLDRQALLEKVYNIRVAAPIVLSQPNTVPDFNSNIFEDIEEMESQTKRVETSLPKWGN